MCAANLVARMLITLKAARMKFKKLYVLMVLAVFTGCISLGLVLLLGS